MSCSMTFVLMYPEQCRQELENALLVAHILNRTLIIPPLYLGHSNMLSWRPFDDLMFQLRLVETLNYNRLFFSDPDFVEPVLMDFLSPDSAGIPLVPFSSIFNLDSLKSAGHKFIDVADFVDLHELKSSADVVHLRDNERYAYRLVDSIPSIDIIDNSSNDMHLSVKSSNPMSSILAGTSKSLTMQWFLMNSTRCLSEDGLPMLEIHSANYNIGRSKNVDVRTELIPAPLKDGDTQRSALRHCSSSKNEAASLMKPLYPDAQSVMLTLGNSQLVQLTMEKYSHAVNLLGNWSFAYDSKLEHRRTPTNPRLIHFGSLFGKTRIESLRADNLRVAEAIRSAMIISNPIVERIANLIIERLGGTGSYVALHLRVGDGNFVKRANATILQAQSVINDWMRNNATLEVYLATDYPQDEIMQSNLFQPLTSRPIKTISAFNDIISSHLGEFDAWRLNSLKEGKITPAWESEMTQLFDEIERLFIADGIQLGRRAKDHGEGRYAAMSHYLNHFRKASHKDRPAETKGPSEFSNIWIPFIEQLVCANAKMVVGTRASTFSDYIERMFRVNWRIPISQSETTRQHNFTFV
eukprot:Partr_v1_DN27917_c3_g1_i2_m11527 putative NA